MKNFNDFFFAALRSKMPSSSQTTIAHTVGVSVQYINEIYNGKKNGSEKVRRQIAEAFGYSYEDFLNLGCSVLGGALANAPEALEPWIREIIPELKRLNRAQKETLISIVRAFKAELSRQEFECGLGQEPDLIVRQKRQTKPKSRLKITRTHDSKPKFAKSSKSKIKK